MILLLVILELLQLLRGYRILGGPLPPTGAVDGIEWIRAQAHGGPGPECAVTGARTWACVMARTESSGVVVIHAGGEIWWGLSERDAAPALQRARWGRLLQFYGTATRSAKLRVSFKYPVAPPAGRLRSIRLDTATVREARAAFVAPDAVWIAGHAPPPKSWLEVTSTVTAPIFLPLEDLVAGPASLPVQVAVTEGRSIHGRVVAASGAPAAGALITVFRLIDPPPTAGNPAPPRRVLAAESSSDEGGGFELPALGDAEYEIVAWHAQHGRASEPLRPGSIDTVVRLRSSGIARGRVLAGGRPLEGVAVISVPDPVAFSGAGDITEVKGGDATTDAAGRFAVTMAPGGGGELRIGGGARPVKRVALPRSPRGVFDAGDVDLGLAIELVIVLDRDPGCGLRAAGPVGRTGLQVVTAVRASSGVFTLSFPEPGWWEISLSCREQAFSVSPTLVQIAAADSGKEVRLTVR